MEFKGKLTKKLEVESGTSKAGKDWKKQSIVINNGDPFNPEVCITFFGDEKISLLKGLKKDEHITVHANVSSREHEGKYYHQIDGWKIDKEAAVVTPPPVKTQVVETPVVDEDFDDLPF